MKWTDEQLRQYRDQGFYLARGLWRSEEVVVLNDVIPGLLSGDEAVDGMHRERERSGAIRQVYLAHRHCEPFKQVARDRRILDPVVQTIESQVYVWHSKINVKDAFEGTVWLWHQDYGYWMWDGVDPKLTSVMVFLDRATINNGCLMVIGGSHKWGRQEHYADTVTTSYKQWCLDTETLKRRVREEDILPITGEPGDVLSFDSYSARLRRFWCTVTDWGASG